jgi:hypothetical protein
MPAPAPLINPFALQRTGAPGTYALLKTGNALARQCCCGGGPCDAEWSCTYCTSTPDSYYIVLDALTICNPSVVDPDGHCWDISTFALSNPAVYCLTQCSEALPCIWEWTEDNDDWVLTRYDDTEGSCSGTSEENNGTLRITLQKVDSTTFRLTIILVSGSYNFIIFDGSATVDENSCMTPFTVGNGYTTDICDALVSFQEDIPGCSSDYESTNNVANIGYNGAAIVYPCCDNPVPGCTALTDSEIGWTSLHINEWESLTLCDQCDRTVGGDAWSGDLSKDTSQDPDIYRGGDTYSGIDMTATISRSDEASCLWTLIIECYDTEETAYIMWQGYLVNATPDGVYIKTDGCYGPSTLTVSVPS